MDPDAPGMVFSNSDIHFAMTSARQPRCSCVCLSSDPSSDANAIHNSELIRRPCRPNRRRSLSASSRANVSHNHEANRR